MPKSKSKTTRCWPGYEPVPGKPQHSQGSCRPKSKSKLTTTPEKQFRAKRKKQLTTWQAKHPNTPKSAAQHLSAPKSAHTRRKKKQTS
jgi:hypothetical protein